MLAFDTIVAPATPPGQGGVGIIRLSGPEAETFLDLVFAGKQKTAAMDSHHLYYGHILNKRGERRDEVLAGIMRSPRSYTGEDVGEVHCHGGTQVMSNGLDLFLDAGARMSSPGEITQRVFLNGRMDLTRA